MIERSFILSPFVVHVYIFILKPLMEQCVKNIIAGILLLRRKSWCVLRVLETVRPCFPPFAAIVGTLPPITGLAWLLGDPIMRVRHR